MCESKNEVTYEEALSVIKKEFDAIYCDDGNEKIKNRINVLERVIEALGWRIPCKVYPVPNNFYDDYEGAICPNCKEIIYKKSGNYESEYWLNDVCACCGQVLDWSEISNYEHIEYDTIS